MASNHKKPRVLIIDDDPVFSSVLGAQLSSDYDVKHAQSGKEGLARALSDPPELILLDIVMPGLTGRDVCQRLKKRIKTSSIPIIILTGSDKEGQEVAFLDQGADDYVLKPQVAGRLLARCRALLRRAGPRGPAADSAQAGAFSLDYNRKLVGFKGKIYPHLTPKEFDLLFEIVSNNPKPCSRRDLYKKVWGDDPPSEVSLKTVEVHIRRIRQKLGLDSNKVLTHISGRGYCLVP